MQNLNSLGLLLGYFDPGSGSLLLQAILGGTAGLAVFAKYLWEQAPGFLRRRKAAVLPQATDRN